MAEDKTALGPGARDDDAANESEVAAKTAETAERKASRTSSRKTKEEEGE